MCPFTSRVTEPDQTEISSDCNQTDTFVRTEDSGTYRDQR